MISRFEKNAGIALLSSSGLLIITMVLHPVGGSIAHLLKITTTIIISHSIALVCLPFYCIGFWGLTKKLGTDNFHAVTGFVIFLFGALAGMIAAAINGLALPVFLINYKDATPDVIESIKPALKYGLALNHAFDFIYIGAVCFSTFFWSMAIVLTKRIKPWLGYFGIAISIVTILVFAFGIVSIDLHGFRIFILGNVVWTILIAQNLLRDRN